MLCLYLFIFSIDKISKFKKSSFEKLYRISDAVADVTFTEDDMESNQQRVSNSSFQRKKSIMNFKMSVKADYESFEELDDDSVIIVLYGNRKV